MGIKPSAPQESSRTNSPARLTPAILPEKTVSPCRDSHSAVNRSTASLSAAAARPFRGRDVFARDGEIRPVVGQGAFAQSQFPDQGPVDQKIGIAANRRREMASSARRASPKCPMLSGEYSACAWVCARPFR